MQNLEGHHQRVLLKLFTKFSGSEAPVSACTGDSFILAIKSLQLNAHGGTSDGKMSVSVVRKVVAANFSTEVDNSSRADEGGGSELLRGMVAQVQQLYMASKHEATWEVDYAREVHYEISCKNATVTVKKSNHRRTVAASAARAWQSMRADVAYA